MAQRKVPEQPSPHPGVERRHRSEWKQQRALLTTAISESSTEKLRLAKLAAEVLRIRQDGERKAWRLDKPVEVKDDEVKEGKGHGPPLVRIKCVVVDPDLGKQDA